MKRGRLLGYGGDDDGTAASATNDRGTGATAICNDGTYSFSQHRQGTCSGHRGMRQFL